MLFTLDVEGPSSSPYCSHLEQGKQKRTTQPFESGKEHVVGFRMRHPDGLGMLLLIWHDAVLQLPMYNSGSEVQDPVFIERPEEHLVECPSTCNCPKHRLKYRLKVAGGVVLSYSV